MAHDIFISYSHKDKTTADAICSHLEGNGLRCWYAPRDIVPGADWADSIIKAINTTKVMVLIFTSNSNISQQVLREVSNAVSSGVPIVPFRLTEEEPIAGMRYYLSTVHWLDAMNAELDSSIQDLGELCKVLVQHSSEKKNEAGSIAITPEEIKQEIAAVHVDSKNASKKKRILLFSALAAVIVIAALLLIFLLPQKASTQKQTEVTNASDTNDAAANNSQDNHTTAVISGTVSLDPTETYTKGNSQGALSSNGYMACDGEWYYYRSNDHQYMYKMSVDGSTTEQMTFEPVSCISVYDGYIYYYTSSNDPCIKRMKTDGSDMSILHYGMVEDLRIVGDRILYRDSQDSLHLYSMNLEGKDVVCENTMERTYSWVTDGSYIYFSNQSDNGSLCRAKMDGTEVACLLSHKIEGMTIAGNLLYFNDLESNKFSTYDLTSGEISELYDDYIYYINVTEDGIYGYSGTQNTYLCYLQLNGLGFRVLVEEPVRNVAVCGEKIFYKNSDDEQYYIVDLEGQNKITP